MASWCGSRIALYSCKVIWCGWIIGEGHACPSWDFRMAFQQTGLISRGTNTLELCWLLIGSAQAWFQLLAKETVVILNLPLVTRHPVAGHQASCKGQLEAARTAAWLVSKSGPSGAQAFFAVDMCPLPACLFLLLGDFLPFSNPVSEAGIQFPGRSLCVPGTRWASLGSPHPSLSTLPQGWGWG